MSAVLVRVPPGSGWHCKRYNKVPCFYLEGKAFCPRCGREVVERTWRRASQPAWTGANYSRVHVGTFHTMDGC